jgi:hypothetical protein
MAICCFVLMLMNRPALAQSAPPTTAPAAGAPTVGALPDGWQEVDQRLVFLTVELSGNETSLAAVNKAIDATGTQKAATTQKADEFAQNNIEMDRNGGGPIPWQDFYGKTAASFYYRPTMTVDAAGQGKTGNGTAKVDATGPMQPIDRPPQLDYIYRANTESQARAEAEAAQLGNQIDKLLARRRELEAEQSALWCKISFRAVTSLDLADQPLYLFDPIAADDDKSEEQETAMAAGRDFVKLANLAVERAQKDVDTNPAQTYDRLQQVVTTSQVNLEKLLLKQRQLTAEMSDPKSPLSQFVKATKRLGDSAQNIVDATELAAKSDTDGDEDRKSNLRGVLQQNLMDFASTMITADQTLTALAAEWKVTPDRRHQAPDVALPAALAAPVKPAAIEGVEGGTDPSASTLFQPPGDNMLVVEVKGAVSVYVNGELAGSGPESEQFHLMTMMLRPMDFLVIRTSSTTIYRGLKFAYTGGNGVDGFGGKPTAAMMRKVSNPDDPAPKQPFDGIEVTSGQGDPKQLKSFNKMGLSADADFIALPSKGTLYDIGYVVPN